MASHAVTVVSSITEREMFRQKCKCQKKVRQVVLEEDLSDTSEEELLSVDLDNEHVLSVNPVDSAYQTKIFVTIETEGKPVKMQIDSGASCNVMPEKFVPKRTEIKGTNQTHCCTINPVSLLRVYARFTLRILRIIRSIEVILLLLKAIVYPYWVLGHHSK